MKYWLLSLLVLLVIGQALNAENIQYHQKLYSLEEWDSFIRDGFSGPVGLSGVDGLRDSLSVGVVAVTDTHTVIFIQTDSILQPGGALLITFPLGFDLSSVSDVIYSDNDESNTDFIFTPEVISGHTIKLVFDPLGSTPVSDSRIAISFYDVFNPTESGNYHIVMAVTDSLGQIIDEPRFSEYFELLPEELNSIVLSDSLVLQVKAGESHQFNATCFDLYENEVDCGLIEWSVIGSNINGEITENGLFFARYVGAPSRVVCTVNELADTSGSVFVTPGDLNTFILSDVPDTVIAGNYFPNEITVTARDVFLNTVGSYEGLVWFESTDTGAIFEVDSTNKYQFLEEDNGSKIFPGQGFVLNTAGLNRLNVTDGDSSSNQCYIVVLPDSPVDFSITHPDTVNAGEEFNIIISSLRDGSGNLLDGVVEVSLLTEGDSPNNTSAIVNSVYVDNGSGVASQTLYRGGNAQFRLTIDTVTKTSQPIYVKNSGGETFDVEISSPQIVGVPFTGTADIIVLDEYGNIVTDFSAENDTVIVKPLGLGEVENDTIGSENAFVNGSCDLIDLEVAYNGPERFLKFEISSQSGISGESGTIEMISSTIERLDLSESSLYRGDPFYASITITNYGSLPLTVDGLNLLTSQGDIVVDSILPELSYDVSGNSSTTFDVYTSIPFTYTSETTRFKASFTGFYNQQPVSDETEYLDSLKILSQQEATYVEGSLNPDVLSRTKDYGLRLALKNLGVNVISLSTESCLYFTNEVDTFKSFLEVPTFLPTTGTDVNLFFNSTTVQNELESGKYSVNLLLKGLQGSSSYEEMLILSDSITLQTAPDLNYINWSLEPDSAFRNIDVNLSLEVSNTGEAPFAINHNLSQLTLESEGRQVVFRPDTQLDTLYPGSNVINFVTGRIPSDFPVETNTLALRLEGSANQHNEIFDISLNSESITILKQGALQIMRTENLSSNSPRVNTQQQFDISVVVQNTGQEALEDVTVVLTSELSTIEDDTLEILSIPSGESDSVVFNITASETTISAEIFRSSIIASSGSQTGLPGILLNPEDNTAVATIQSPARISSEFRIVSPPEALDGVLDVGQVFSVQAEFDNLGEAEVDLGMARIILPEGFTTENALTMAFETGTPVEWELQSALDPVETEIVMEIVAAPVDQNALLPAILENETDTITVSVVEQLPSVEIRSVFEAYDLVFPGQSLSLLRLIFETSSDQPADRAIVSDLVFNFSDREGIAVDAENVFLSGTIMYDGNQYEAGITSNRMEFDFGQEIIFGIDENAELVLEVVIASDSEIENFVISTDSSLVKCYDYTYGMIGKNLVVTGINGQEFRIEKDYGAVSTEFEASFYNYPNPFNPDLESTAVVYYLPVNSDVQFDVYTLIGEHVFSTTLESGSSGGLGGQINKFYWSGHNSVGMKVREGVYIAVLSYSGGEARTKIAIVK